ncbi:MAG TPA: peptidylprolyl isomerase [Candidatus Limnocylindrales bacterium]
MYITLLFSLAIAAAVSMMGGVFAAGYYTDHWAAIATANGEQISKDAVRDRAALNLARYERQTANFQTMRNQNKITTAEFSTLTSAITTSESSSTLYSDALTQLINEAELRQYAAKNNISVTDQMVDAQVVTDGTVSELRHVKVIGVPTTPTPPASAPTSSDDAAALAKAQGYLKEIQDGKAWADVDTEATNANSNSGGGDLGLVSRETIAADPDLADAVFALQKVGDITTIFKGSDGAYRFATITSIVTKYVDTDWEASIAAAANGDQLRAYARGAAIQKAIQATIEAKYITGATTQRKVQEIAISAGVGQAGDGDEIKMRMMVFAPNHDAANASSVAETDAAWTDAKARADAAVAKLRADPSQWNAMAVDTNVNDDTLWRPYSGDIQWWLPADVFNATTAASSQGLDMTSVQAAVFKTGLTVGEFLDPIKESAQGYVVVQFQGRRQAPLQRIANAQFDINSGVDFGTTAKTYSEVADAINGGDLGWVSPYMLTAAQEQVIYSTPVGRVSNIVSGSGYYIYKITEEQTRVADATQQAKLKKVVFSAWLTEFQANALVWKDSAALTALTPGGSTSSAT